MLDITVIILSFNEDLHIARCINSVKCISNKIYVIDSYSNDNTVNIAKDLGAIVFQNKWENSHSKQFNFALSILPEDTKWILRIDADEYIDDKLYNEIFAFKKNNNLNISGIMFKSKRIFLNKYLKYGNVTYNNLRLFKMNSGKMTMNYMDEHIYITEGKVFISKAAIYDHNLNDMSWWINKHNNYSTREAADYFFNYYNLNISNFNKEDSFSRRNKKIYYKLPILLRPFLYFSFRYFFCFGFLDGTAGFIWHFFQALWYRLLVDVKILEIRLRFGNNYFLIQDYFTKNYNILI